MILVTAAMAEELQELLPLEQYTGSGFPEAVIREYSVCAAVIGIGTVLSACRIGELLERCRPERVVHIGICGGLTPGVSAGEFILPSWTVQHDLGPLPFSRTDRNGAFAFDRIELNSPRREAYGDSLRQAAGGGKVHLQGGIATGDGFVTGEQRLSLAGRFPPGEQAVCDMETFSVAAACRIRGIDLVVMKAVSDDAHRRVKHLSRYLAKISRILCRAALLPRQDD